MSNNKKKIFTRMVCTDSRVCICIYKSREDTGAKPRLCSSKSFQLYCLKINYMASRSVIAPWLNCTLSETENEHCVIRGKHWKICMPFHRSSAREKPPSTRGMKISRLLVWAQEFSAKGGRCDWIELLCTSAASKDGHNCWNVVQTGQSAQLQRP